MMEERTHLSTDQISAFIDDALMGDEHASARQHLDACGACAQETARMRSVSRLVAGLGEVTVDADAHRVIRQAVLTQTKAGPARRWRLVAASGTALLIVAGGAWFATSGRQMKGGEVASGLRADSEALSFDDEGAVRDAVVKDPAVIAGLKSYRVRDVGETKRKLALQDTGGGSGTTSGAATEADDRSSGPSAGSSTDKLAAHARTFAVPVTECLDRVLASQPYPMVPLVTTDARFKGAPAWLFVFAWTTSTADDARLDRLQIWLMGQDDCGTLSFAQLKP